MFLGSSFDIYGEFISKEKGYGVFTREAIPSDTLIEVCYCIPASTYQWEDYVFGDPRVLPLGYGSIYNHSDDANIVWKKVNKEFIIYFISRKNIKAGEELCHNYGPGYWKDSNKMKLI